MLVSGLAVEFACEDEFSIDKECNLARLPIEQNIELVPLILLKFYVYELCCVDFESLLIAHSMEHSSAQSTFLFIALFERKFKLAFLLFLLVVVTFHQVSSPEVQSSDLLLRLFVHFKEPQIAAFCVLSTCLAPERYMGRLSIIKPEHQPVIESELCFFLLFQL